MSRPSPLGIIVGSVAAIVVVALVVTAATAVVTVNRPIPERDGSVRVPGVSAEVEVLRDARGVPRIYADTADDLFLAQGYVHAQDRFFEMDLRRHITAGRLSELVGENPEVLEADVVVRTLGWRRVAEEELSQLDPETRRYLDAYSEGVNAYLSERSPGSLSLAYTVLGLQVPLEEIEPWTPADSLAWLKAMSWDLKSNYDDELARALLLSRDQTPERVAELFPPYDGEEHRAVVPPGEPADDRPGRGEAAGRTAAGTPPGDGEPAPVPPVEDAAPVPPAEDAAAEPPGEDAAPVPPGEDAGEDPAEAAGAGGLDDALSQPEVADVLAATSSALLGAPSLLHTPGRVGSNSWVVSGEHTASGAPLLANDPHIGPESPSAWYQVGLHCRTVDDSCPFDVSGYSFAGMPGVIIGHNADVAWGLTNMNADQSDFVLERVVDGEYEVDGERQPLEERVEVIEVAGAEPVEITVRETRNGPVVSDVLDTVAQAGRDYPAQPGAPRGETGYAVSLRWVALEPTRTGDAIFAIGRAQDWDDFLAAAELLDAPAQNLVYADTDGHIGYVAPGRIPVRGVGDGTLPALGWDTGHDWQGYLPPEDLPAVLDPEQGYLVAANQRVVDPQEGPFLGADPDYGYRSQRIDDLLSLAVATGGIDVEAMRQLQNDDLNPFAVTLLPYLRDIDRLDDFTLEAVDLLDGWDGSQPADSAAAAYYNAVYAEVLELTFEDELPEELWPSGGDRWFAVMERLLEDPGNEWWDDVRTLNVVETRDGILSDALVEARLELTRRLGKEPGSWQWGQLHGLEATHTPLGSEASPMLVREVFNLDRVPLSGGTSAVNATSWQADSGSFDATNLPSMRMVVDLGDLDRSRWVDLTGVSGHPFDDYHGNQLGTWARGELYPWPFTRRAVVEAAGDRLLLQPATAP